MTTPPRRWIGFFVVLGLLTTAGIVINFVYNLSIQLRPQQLAEAKRRWQDNRPDNYDLKYLVRIDREGESESEKDGYFVKVRGGKTVLIADNYEIIYLDPALACVTGPASLGVSSVDPQRFDVPALFARIEQGRVEDEKAGRRNYATAQFDPKYGLPFHYVHRIRGTHNRLEWNAQLTRVAESQPSGNGDNSAP